MAYTKTLTLDQEKIMNAKVILVSTPLAPVTIEDLLNKIVDGYIANCGRDVGSDLDMKVRIKVEKMTEAEKKAFIA